MPKFIWRILTLVSTGYATQDGRKFMLSPKLLTMSRTWISNSSLWSFAEPFMRALSQRLNESCSAAILADEDVGLASTLVDNHPEAEIWVVGGVSGPADLDRLAEAGVAAVLIGSALRNGRIGRADLHASLHHPRQVM